MVLLLLLFFVGRGFSTQRTKERVEPIDREYVCVTFFDRRWNIDTGRFERGKCEEMQIKLLEGEGLVVVAVAERLKY